MHQCMVPTQTEIQIHQFEEGYNYTYSKSRIWIQETPGTVLNAVDGENHQFIDILIENEQKMVISEYVVQVELSSILFDLAQIFL